jgi:hypothetical protein
VPGIMWAPGKIPAGVTLDEMMSHIDCWSTLATMVGLKAPPTGEMMDNNGKPIYFDSIDNSAYVMGNAEHSARGSWIYIDGETFQGVARTLVTTRMLRGSGSRGRRSSRRRTPGWAQS